MSDECTFLDYQTYTNLYSNQTSTLGIGSDDVQYR